MKPTNFRRNRGYGQRRQRGPTLSQQWNDQPVETTQTRASGGVGQFSDAPAEPEFVEAQPVRAASGPVNVFFARVKRDPQIMGLFARLKAGTYTLDLAGYTRELRHIQFDRDFRHPDIHNRVLQDSQRVLTKADTQLSAYRSRAAEIRMFCYELSDVIDELIDSASKYMQAQYATELKNSGYTTDKGRKDAVDHVMAQFRKRKRELDRVIEISKIVIEDLDKSSFNVNHIIEVLKLNVSRGRGL